MGKTIIISNRLPVKVSQKNHRYIFSPSEGGLATGLNSVFKKDDNLWIGWPGLPINKQEDKEYINRFLRGKKMIPVFLSKILIANFYEGFSNETIWPIYHYFLQYAVFDQKKFSAYVDANKKYLYAVLEVAEPDDTIWVHDYQLLLLPQMIREKLPNASIGFFQHIPFPSFEVFRMIPWRKEILTGMLGSDLIGFHTYDDMRHFLSAVSRIAGISNSRGRLNTRKRMIEVDSFPMGIDYEKYARAAASPAAVEKEKRYRRSLENQKSILAIDRLDYSKGIPQRMLAFELFLDKHPQYHEKVSLIQIVVPSRDNVGQYKELKEEIELLVGRINGKYARINWKPIHYFYRSLPQESLSGFYRLADVALVTPMRDGMNLVCKEYIASKINQKGVLILSEMAGASKELSDAILVNPNDLNQMAEAIYKALNMPVSEQKAHIGIMQASLRRYNIHHWVKMFMDRLEFFKNFQRSMATTNLDQTTSARIVRKFKKSKHRILFLDYDGTLTGFKPEPHLAIPDRELNTLLRKLTHNKKNRVVIITGRERTSLEEWFSTFQVDLIAEHGVWFKEYAGQWHNPENLHNAWKEEIRPVLELYVGRTPGSFIEEKDHSLAWHFRKVETGLGELRSRELTSHLKYLSANKNLQVLIGNMVVEIKSMDINKGVAAKHWLVKFPNDCIIAIGDDWTDEDTFKAMPKEAVTIKVGSTSSEAKYHVASYQEVRDFLKKLVS